MHMLVVVRDTQISQPCLRGLVTDQDLRLAEDEFPGISAFYATRTGKDRTFLDLLAAFLGLCDHVTMH